MANKNANVMLIEELGCFFLSSTHLDNFFSETNIFYYVASIVDITPLPIPEEPDMTIKRPLCEYDGEIEELRITDALLVGAGISAYDAAILNGFVGTEQEWLDSLKGTPGSSGVINLWN